MPYASTSFAGFRIHRTHRLTGGLRLLARHLRIWRRNRQTRRLIARLSSDQRADIGCPDPPRAVLGVDPVLLARLKAMR